MDKKDKVKRTLKLRLLPTKEQEDLMWKHINHSRFLRNKLVEKGNEAIENSKSIGKYYFYEHIKELCNTEEYKFLKDVSKSSLKSIGEELSLSYRRYFNHTSEKPKFHKKGKCSNYYFPRSDSKDKFYIDENNKIKIEKLGRVKISNNSLKNNYDVIQDIKKYDRLRKSVIRKDSKYWYITIQYNVEDIQREQVEYKEDYQESIGIDMGLKTLLVCSDGDEYYNISDSDNYKKVEKRLKKLQKDVSRKYEANKQGNEYIKTNNILKTEQEIRKYYRKLTNIKDTYTHTITKRIVEKRPEAIYIEDLDIDDMKRKKHLANRVTTCNFYDIRRKLEYKAYNYGIKLVVVDKKYPSTQICSNCENRKEGKDKVTTSRMYVCHKCGYKEDRDINASYNLKNYYNSKWYKENKL